MPGSGIPERLRDWPPNDEGEPDIRGMAKHCSDSIKSFGKDYQAFRESVDQKALHDILTRMHDDGLAGLTIDDLPHLGNALALTIANDTLHEASACLQMLRQHVQAPPIDMN